MRTRPPPDRGGVAQGPTTRNARIYARQIARHFDILNWCAHVLFQYRPAEQSPASQHTAETVEFEDWGIMQIDDDPETSQSHLALQNGPLALADGPADGNREETSAVRKQKRHTHETEQPERRVLEVVAHSAGATYAPH
jgi:hypothetical protein